MHCLLFMYLLAPFIFQWFFLRLSLLEGIFKSMSPQVLRDRFIWRSPEERGQCGTRGHLEGDTMLWGMLGDAKTLESSQQQKN